MTPYKEITNPKQMADFMTHVDDFHDALIKECHLINSAYIDAKSLAMDMNFNFGARVLIQIQSEITPVIELIFVDLFKFDFNKSQEIFSATGYVITEKLSQYLRIGIDFDDDLIIEARGLYYREVCQWLGKIARYGNYYAGTKITDKIQDIGEGYLFCSNCGHSWKPILPQLLTSCPNCDSSFLLYSNMKKIIVCLAGNIVTLG